MNSSRNGARLERSLRLTVPTERIAADVVDGEAVIINLDTGSYYTTEGVGCDVWVLLASGMTLGQTLDQLSSRYEVPDDDLLTDYVDSLVGVLLREGLMTEAVDASPTAMADPLPPTAARIPFEPADFVSYDDMRQLLLLDPVHEVDERGWPHAAAGG